MELGNRCPFCGGNDCERNVAVIGIGVGGDAFHIRCEKGFDCTLYSSIWLENDGREIKKRGCLTLHFNIISQKSFI